MLKKDHLKDLRIMVADPDQQMSKVLATVLHSMGFRRIVNVSDGRAALNHLSLHTVDILITEWQMSPIDGIELVSTLRKADDSPCRTVPIIMLTARADQYDVEQARDAGVNEFVIKPYTARTLYNRIEKLVDSPRGFIVTSAYVGPERRRHTLISPPMERRKQIPQAALDADWVRKNAYYTPSVIPPDHLLKRRLSISAPLDHIITQEVLTRAQNAIDRIRGESQTWIREDIQELESGYAELCSNPAGAVVEKLKNISLTIISRAGTFGFSFASNVALLLYRFLRNHYMPGSNLHNVIVLKHLQTLKVVFASNLQGQDSTLAEELLNELRALVLRTHKRIAT